MNSLMKNAMSVDVEDYFQVTAFDNFISPDDWDNLPCRVEQNTYKILSCFLKHDVKATFFVLGWVAERFPELIREIVAQGHEVASHGYAHKRATLQSRKQFRKDIIKAKNILEDITLCEIKGYRAPSYSINKSNMWVHDELYDTGHIYSSSVYPVKHDLYGIPDAPRFKYLLPDGLIEIPISTIKLLNKNFPAGGGGFFRFYPYTVSKLIINIINSREHQAVIFYFHPWEIDPEQPRQMQASLKSKFRHYLNLHKTESRISELLTDFQWDRIDKVFDL
jgi:polysaccharide deacetylase family protein (PEP-CTERM system associated)